MYSESLIGALQQTHDVLSGVQSITVLDYEPPPGAATSPVAIVSLIGARVAEDEYTIRVRVYVSASRHGGVRDAQLFAAETIDEIDEAFATASAPFSGDIDYSESLDAFVGVFATTVSRT